MSAPNYAASYDAAGDMTGRGANVLNYDALRRLTHWQNAATMNHPSQTANYAYDGEGERVMQQANSIQNPGLPSNIITTTTTYYIGGFEEVSTTTQSGACSPCNPPSTTTIKYYNAGVTMAESVNGTISYLVQDSLGSISEALDTTGNVTAAQLFLPYGSTRYTSGTMPTSYAFTGQQSDPSGLMYFHARYYDASVGQFIAADIIQGPNRFAYVNANPETLTDPSGHDTVVDRLIIEGEAEDGTIAPGEMEIGSVTGETSAELQETEQQSLNEFMEETENCGFVENDLEIDQTEVDTETPEAQAQAKAKAEQQVTDDPPANPTTPNSGNDNGDSGSGNGNQNSNAQPSEPPQETPSNGGNTTGNSQFTDQPPSPSEPSTYVIGEGQQTRVIIYANKYGYKYYKPRLPSDVGRNTRWIQGKIRSGSQIVDIGPDGRDDPSLYYAAEVDASDGYGNYYMDSDVWMLFPQDW